MRRQLSHQNGPRDQRRRGEVTVEKGLVHGITVGIHVVGDGRGRAQRPDQVALMRAISVWMSCCSSLTQLL